MRSLYRRTSPPTWRKAARPRICIQNNYLKAGRHSRGIKPQLLRVLYATDMPGVLTEIGFMSNPQEAAYMKSEKGQNEIARSLLPGRAGLFVLCDRNAHGRGGAGEARRSGTRGEARGRAAEAENGAREAERETRRGETENGCRETGR
ncbi:MAG: N-acetylmuramoyl-L-alanine amidase [Alistipes senegalensis]